MSYTGHISNSINTKEDQLWEAFRHLLAGIPAAMNRLLRQLSFCR